MSLVSFLLSSVEYIIRQTPYVFRPLRRLRTFYVIQTQFHRMTAPIGQAHPSRVLYLTKRILAVLFLGLGIYLILNFSRFLGGSFDTIQNGKPLSFTLLFIAGTLTGFHCAGMCGALVVGYTVRSANEGGSRYLTHFYYGAGKTLSYTVIGGLFGALGAFVTFTPFMRGMAGLIAGVFLILFGLSTLRVFQPLSRFRLRTPGFIMRWVGGALRRNSNPFVIGLLNGLMIICGPLQAMYIMAAGTGNPIEGAEMLLAFGLGTLPLMMGFGMLASALSRQFAPMLVRASGIVVVVLGIIMFNRGYLMVKTGEDMHAGMMAHGGHDMAAEAPEMMMVHTEITRPGPITEKPTLKVGEPVNWMIGGEGLSACGGQISVPTVGLVFDIHPGMNQIQFTPRQAGEISWSCNKGGIRGSFEAAVAPESPQKSAGSSEIPMAVRIRELLEKTATAIEALRGQLHP